MCHYGANTPTILFFRLTLFQNCEIETRDMKHQAYNIMQWYEVYSVYSREVTSSSSVENSSSMNALKTDLPLNHIFHLQHCCCRLGPSDGAHATKLFFLIDRITETSRSAALTLNPRGPDYSQLSDSGHFYLKLKTFHQSYGRSGAHIGLMAMSFFCHVWSIKSRWIRLS